MKQDFWTVEYKDFIDGVTFKFKKLSSLEVLDLADRNIGKDADSKKFKLDCLRSVLWTKDGSQWFELLDEDGNSTLPEAPYPIILDIFYKFRSEVCLPVFTESRAYQSLVQQAGEKEAEKHSKKQQ